MILYLLQLSMIWTILLIAFYVFYKNQTYHKFNRLYILISLFAGIVIPLLPAEPIHHEISILTPAYQMIDMISVINSRVAASGNNFMHFFIVFIWIFYASLVILKLYRTIRELSHYSKITKRKRVFVENAFIQYTDDVEQPFSFFNIIVLPSNLEYDDKTKNIIIAHEITHIKSKHYYDLVFLKMIEILLPFHPCLYFFKKELVLIHEYQADKLTVMHTNEEEYTQVLIQFAQKPHLHGSIIHTFYFSPIESRIKMLFKKSYWSRYLFIAVAPVLFTTCKYLNSDFEYEFQTFLPNIIKGDSTITHSNSVSGFSDFLLPDFPGGEKALMEFLGKNIRYPEDGRQNQIEGTSYVKFDVYEDGSIHNKTVIRTIGKEFDKELFRVIDLMPNWIPAEKDGFKVWRSYTLPVKFKLSE